MSEAECLEDERVHQVHWECKVERVQQAEGRSVLAPPSRTDTTQNSPDQANL